MTQTLVEQLLSILAAVVATLLTRFTPFVLFPPGRRTPAFVQYLGRWLPSAVFAMLVVYCVRGVDFAAAPHGAPELLAIAATALLHVWRRQMFLSIAGGTALYMWLVQQVFA